MAGSPLSTSRSSMAARRRPLKVRRKCNGTNTIKSRLTALDVREFEHLLCEALNIHRALEPKPPTRQLTQLHDEQDVERSEPDAIAQYAVRLSNLRPAGTVSTHADEMVRILHNIHWAASWEVYVPSRLGNDCKVDAAAHALALAYRYKFLNDTALAGPAYRQYGLALNAIRESIDTTDASLLAVGLLCLFESFMQVYSSYQLAHREGIGKILLARRNMEVGDGPSEVERAAVFGDWNLKYRVPLSRGTVSPFDDPYWLDMEPPRAFGMPEGLSRMQKIGSRLLIRLPRLAAEIRDLREQSIRQEDLLKTSAAATVSLADELLKLTDGAAESEILHRVSVVKTDDAYDRALVPYSFNFHTFKEFEGAMLYWRMRLEILRCCHALRQLPLTAGRADSTFQQDGVAVKTEMERILTNIIMSRQYAMSHGMFGRLRLLETLFPCWGASSILTEWRGFDTSFLRSWILMRFNNAWAGWGRKPDAENMDEMCNVSVGGPLKGWFVNKHKADNQAVNVPTVGGR